MALDCWFRVRDAGLVLDPWVRVCVWSWCGNSYLERFAIVLVLWWGFVVWCAWALLSPRVRICAWSWCGNSCLERFAIVLVDGSHFSVGDLWFGEPSYVYNFVFVPGRSVVTLIERDLRLCWFSVLDLSPLEPDHPCFRYLRHPICSMYYCSNSTIGWSTEVLAEFVVLTNMTRCWLFCVFCLIPCEV
jgi:hypothetical protein